MMNPFQRRSGAVPAGSAGPPTPRFGAPAAAPKPQTALAPRGPQTTAPAGPPRPQGYQWPAPPQRKVPGAPPAPRPFPASTPPAPVAQQTSGGTAPPGYTGAPTNPGAGAARPAGLPGPPPQLPQLSFAQWQMKYAQPWMHRQQDYRSPAAGPAAEIPQYSKGNTDTTQLAERDPRQAWMDAHANDPAFAGYTEQGKASEMERQWQRADPAGYRKQQQQQEIARLSQTYGGFGRIPPQALQRLGYGA